MVGIFLPVTGSTVVHDVNTMGVLALTVARTVGFHHGVAGTIDSDLLVVRYRNA